MAYTSPAVVTHVRRGGRPLRSISGDVRRTDARRLLPLGLALLLLSACGGDGESTGSSSTPTSPNGPIIENLRVSYTPTNPLVGTPTQIGFVVDVVDPDGDWVSGRCRFVTGDQIELPIVAPGVPTNAKSGTATCILVAAFRNDVTRVDLAVVDRAGNQSNVLSNLVTLESPGPPRR